MMTYDGLKRAVSNQSGIPLATTKDVMDTLVDVMGESLKCGDGFKFPNFGSFTILHMPEKEYHVPSKGWTTIDEHYKVKFRPSRALKEYINGKREMLH